MLDIQELEPRSGEICVVRQLERNELKLLGHANEKLASQNARVLAAADGWLAKSGTPESNSTNANSLAWPYRLLRTLRRQCRHRLRK